MDNRSGSRIGRAIRPWGCVCLLWPGPACRASAPAGRGVYLTTVKLTDAGAVVPLLLLAVSVAV